MASSSSSVALLGCGLMGTKMALRLASQGFKIAAWNRDKKKADDLAEANAKQIVAVDAAAQAVQQSRVVLIMLADGPSISQVVLQDEAVRCQLKDRVVLMMSTILPSESKDIAGQVQAAGGLYIEAPVLGSQPEAESGRLQILVGCKDEHAAEASSGWRVLCVLSHLPPRKLGPVGSAASVKLALNQLIVTETLAFTASLGLVQKSGASVEHFLEVLRASNYYSPTFDKKLPRYLSRDFTGPNFPTKHLLKDAQLFCTEAERAHIDARVQRAAEAIIKTTCDMRDLAECDYSSVYEAVVHGPGSSSAAQQ